MSRNNQKLILQSFLKGSAFLEIVLHQFYVSFCLIICTIKTVHEIIEFVIDFKFKSLYILFRHPFQQVNTQIQPLKNKPRALTNITKHPNLGLGLLASREAKGSGIGFFPKLLRGVIGSTSSKLSKESTISLFSSSYLYLSDNLHIHTWHCKVAKSHLEARPWSLVR